MSDLPIRLKKAKTDNSELNSLIADYLPFIKSETLKTPVFHMDFDDRLSVAMLVFMNCVRQFDEESGSFLNFAAISIRNRLIDEGKKYERHRDRTVPMFEENENGEVIGHIDSTVSKFRYDIETENSYLSDEIDRLSCQLSRFGITFDILPDISPKQSRSRNLCLNLAREIISDNALKEQFFHKYRVPQAELARRFNISEKTVEKHRRFIVTIALILSGDYPGIQTFLPKGGGAD